MTRSFFILCILFTSVKLLSQVELRDTLIKWKRYEYSLNEHYGISTYSTTTIIQDTLEGKVIENELIRICLIPEFGGRVISYVYKPTGHEQLYQNEVGVPYLLDQNIFYHEWLMLYGGIFPTFPEPEHGKYWNYPWNIDITEESAGKVSVSMWLKDELDNPVHPSRYNNGITGITCYFDVTVEAGKPFFTADVSLINDTTESNYEYWTNIGFAPGSEIGNSFITENSEMIVPIEQYQVGWNQGNWMQNADLTISSNLFYVNEYKNLAFIRNWEEQGIAYAYPSFTSNYFGVINHDVGEGLFRITDNPTATPGLKFWGWGAEQGKNADVNNFYDYARPMIELWAGVSHEFFDDAFLSASQKISWKETYFTTVGLPGVSFMNDEFGFYQNLSPENELEISVFLPVLKQEGNILLDYEIKNSLEEVVWTKSDTLQENLIKSQTNKYDLNSLGLAIGDYTWNTTIVTEGNANIYNQKENFKISTASISALEPVTFSFSISNPYPGQLNLSFNSNDEKAVYLYDLHGRMIQNTNHVTSFLKLSGLQPGIYICKAVKNNNFVIKKIFVN